VAGKKEQDKDTKAFYNALVAYRDEGKSYRQIAKELNRDGYTTPGGAQWSGNAVARMLAGFKRASEQPTPPTPKLTFPMVIPVERHRDGQVAGMQIQAPSTDYSEEVIETEEEWLAMKAAAEATRKWMAERKSKPRDWRKPDFDMLQLQAFDSLALAGKDTWHQAVLPLVVQQIEETGKEPMALIDQIEGQPDVKGQLRRVFFGMLRALAKAQETERALRAKYEPDPEVTREFEAWKRSKMVE
jgi:hypothetical protein